ncbi:MAG: hypothetical protein BWY79_00738 [Actinobacteria bacterium ADurb.Bin444]|nr:MAG: hypothetical protein BWY79_00738 [Actinobacteria bacterium ADurb.Bin444]
MKFRFVSVARRTVAAVVATAVVAWGSHWPQVERAVVPPGPVVVVVVSSPPRRRGGSVA